jgi:hypothetical protein
MPKPELVLCRGWRGVGAYAAKILQTWTARDVLAPSRSLMLVPTEAAAHLLRAQLEASVLATNDVAFMPTIATPSRLIDELVARCEGRARLVDPLLREALLQHAFERIAKTETEPPFELRGGLARRVLEFYDTLLMNRFDLETFTARAIEELDAPDDEGAEKLSRQTRFLHASLTAYRSALDELGLSDPPSARARLREEVFPFEHALVLGSETLCPLDLEFFTAIEGLMSLTLVVAEPSEALADSLVRAIPERRIEDATEHPSPRLLSAEPLVARDREESLVDALRILKQTDTSVHRVAIVVPQPLAYLYLAKKILDEAGVAYELQDTFPLATEPYVASVDLALEIVETDAHRSSALALLRSPFFQFKGVGPGEVAAFDAMTLRYREPGSSRTWARLYERKSRPPAQAALPGMESGTSSTRVLPPLAALVETTRALAPLGRDNPITDKIACLRAFLGDYSCPVPGARHRRARGALASILERLEAAAPHVGNPAIDFKTFRDRFRRAVEAHTFDTRSGGGGVTVVDARSAGFGSFDLVILLGVNDGEWPARGERNIFFPQWLLREFGWLSDRELLGRERNRFRLLLDLGVKNVALLRHQLEDEIPTVPSPFLEEVDAWRQDRSDSWHDHTFDPDELRALVVTRSEALRRRLITADGVRSRDPHPGHVGALSVSDPVSPTSLELYLRCPFKYFSRYLLGLEEEEDVDEMLTPLERGRMLHDLLQEGFESWDAGSDAPRPITAESYEDALRAFHEIAMKIVPPEHRRVELPRLFGGAGEPGAVEWLLRWELTRGPLERRLIEYGFQSPLRLEAGPRGEKPWFVRIKGRVDRADIDAQGRLHVFDYKSGRAPEPAVTLQVPLYAMCLSQDLNAPVAESAYLSFRDRRTVSRMDFQKTSALLIETYRSIQDGEFPPRPHQEPLCYSCGFVGVCRKQIQEET